MKTVCKCEGFCPFTNESRAILVSYAEVRAIGMRGFKKMGFTCVVGDECAVVMEGECPIYLSAPPSPNQA